MSITRGRVLYLLFLDASIPLAQPALSSAVVRLGSVAVARRRRR
jgi:hypothetical protein